MKPITLDFLIFLGIISLALIGLRTVLLYVLRHTRTIYYDEKDNKFLEEKLKQ
jgi:hypothetical protein